MLLAVRKTVSICFYTSQLVILGLAFYHDLLWEILVSPSILIFCFISLGLLTSDYLTPCLSVISREILNISDRVSGMTLLALGNAIPDITSTYQSMNSDVTSLAIGELMGAILFLLTVILGLMAMTRPIDLYSPGGVEDEETIFDENQQGIPYDRNQFLKDLLMFSFMIFMTIIFLYDGRLMFWECFVMVTTYCSYVYYLLFYGGMTAALGSPLDTSSIDSLVEDEQGNSNENFDINISRFMNSTKERRANIRKKIRTYLRSNYRGWMRLTLNDTLELWENHKLFENSTEDLGTPRVSPEREHIFRTTSEYNFSQTPFNPPRSKDQLRQNGIPESPEDTLESTRFLPPQRTSTMRSMSADHLLLLDNKIRSSQCSITDPCGPLDEESDIETNSYVPSIRSMRKETFWYKFNKSLKLPELLYNESIKISWLEFVFVLITTPMIVLFTLIIPLHHEDEHSRTGLHYSRLRLIQLGISPFTVSYLLLEQASIIAGAVSASLILLLLLLNRLDKLPQNSKYISIIGFILSISSISFIVKVVVSTLTNWVQVFHISETILGLTIFAWGNSIGDLISNITFTKIGVLEIALGACFGSPLLYFLLGVGVDGMLIMSRRKDSTQTSIWTRHIDFKVDMNLVTSCVGLVIAFAIFTIAVPLNSWQIDRKIGIFLLVVYLSVSGINIYSEL